MAVLTPVRSALVLVLLLTGAAVPGVRAQDTLENDVKAAFLFNFTKFIEWPSLPPAGEPFRICVVADAAFARSLDRIVEGESVEGHRLQRVEAHSADDARGCQILFVGRSQAERGMALAHAVRQAAVLTVSDVPGFVEHGGAIGFILDDNRVRFDVNTAAVQRARLRVSSKLLRVARRVSEGGTR